MRELRKRGGSEGSPSETDRLERELARERERGRRYERLIEEKEAELQHGHKDSVGAVLCMRCLLTLCS